MLQEPDHYAARIKSYIEKYGQAAAEAAAAAEEEEDDDDDESNDDGD